jgi:hypothetical protein
MGLDQSALLDNGLFFFQPVKDELPHPNRVRGLELQSSAISAENQHPFERNIKDQNTIVRKTDHVGDSLLPL